MSCGRGAIRGAVFCPAARPPEAQSGVYGVGSTEGRRSSGLLAPGAALSLRTRQYQHAVQPAPAWVLALVDDVQSTTAARARAASPSHSYGRWRAALARRAGVRAWGIPAVPPEPKYVLLLERRGGQARTNVLE